MRSHWWMHFAFFMSCSGVLLPWGNAQSPKARREELHGRRWWVVIQAPNPPGIPEALLIPRESKLTEEVAAPEASSLKLEMVAKQDAWVEIETDGVPAYAKLVHTDQTLKFEASESIRLKTGNAAGLELRLNGAPVSATNGNIRKRSMVEFTSEGTRYLKGWTHTARSEQSDPGDKS
jgi:hypothetical protein